MFVQLNEAGYVENYALIGNIENGIELSEPADIDHFKQHFTAYRVRDGDPVFDEEKEKALAKSRAVEEYRRQRESECFSVVNRGQLWYERLTDKQQEELRQWYKAWLDGTNTQTIPKKPSWI